MLFVCLFVLYYKVQPDKDLWLSEFPKSGKHKITTLEAAVEITLSSKMRNNLFKGIKMDADFIFIKSILYMIEGSLFLNKRANKLFIVIYQAITLQPLLYISNP